MPAPQLFIIGIALIVLLVLFLKYKRKFTVPFTSALILSLVWTSLVRYEYVDENIFLFNHINIFPLILWTAGLTLTFFVYKNMKGNYPFFSTSILYLIVLFAAEAIGYHLLSIRLISNYPSLFGLGIIHAPVFMKFFYVFAGPVYVLFISRISKTPL